MNKQEIEKAIEVLRDFNRCVKAKADGAYETTDFINAKETAISALEQQLTNGWIPVSEQSPKHTGDYNVTVGVGSELGYFEEVRTYRYEIHNGKNPHKKWIIPNNFHETVNVIAWQPLPEPYKEDKDADN